MEQFNMIKHESEQWFRFNGAKVTKGMWYGTGWGAVPVITNCYIQNGKMKFLIADQYNSQWDDIWIDLDDPRIPIDIQQWLYAKKKGGVLVSNESRLCNYAKDWHNK